MIIGEKNLILFFPETTESFKRQLYRANYWKAPWVVFYVFFVQIRNPGHLPPHNIV
jgi:hypothetical protein